MTDDLNLPEEPIDRSSASPWAYVLAALLVLIGLVAGVAVGLAL